MIEINNLTTIAVGKKFLEGLAEKVLKGENKEGLDLSIVFVGEARIRKLNKKYRRRNQTTDILSFGEGLNEIVICPRAVKKNAEKYNSTFKKELARVLIHGILHLIGYKHEKNGKEAKKMEKRQDYYLDMLKC